MRIIFLGPPGAGKGTQAVSVAQRYGIPQISTGNILRDAIQKGTSLGKEAKSYSERGELAPDNIVIGIIKERLRHPDSRGGYLLDGFPRNIKQAEALSMMIKDLGETISHVVSFELDEKEIVRRLSGRRSCPHCHTVYQIFDNPPRKEGICDQCGQRLVQREDDREETIQRRLRVYKDETEPLLSYYKNKELLVRVDAAGSVEDVFERLRGVLAKKA